MPNATTQVLSAVARAGNEEEDACNHVDDERHEKDEPQLIQAID